MFGLHRANLIPVLAILWLAPSVQLYSQIGESLAILDLEGRGISTIEAASLTDRLRTALVRIGAVTVVERGQMQQVLKEQDFQLTGCTSDECAVEVGQLLGVSTMVAGSIGKVGSTYSIDIRTIDVGTGKITHSMFRDYRGEVDDLLGIMPEIAKELVEAVMAMGPPTATAPEPASLTIDSDPSGAQVTLDGQAVGQTPLGDVGLIPNAQHTISLGLAGYQQADTTLFTEAGRSYVLNLTLRRLMSLVVIRSSPSRATVYLDNASIGLTPLPMREVSSNVEHTLSFRLTGYLPVDTTFFAQAGSQQQLNITLQPVPVAATAARTPGAAPTEIQLPRPPPQVKKGGGGFTWLMLIALAGGGYYGYTQGWFGGIDPGNGGSDAGPTVGNPPGVPVP